MKSEKRLFKIWYFLICISFLYLPIAFTKDANLTDTKDNPETTPSYEQEKSRQAADQIWEKGIDKNEDGVIDETELKLWKEKQTNKYKQKDTPQQPFGSTLKKEPYMNEEGIDDETEPNTQEEKQTNKYKQQDKSQQPFDSTLKKEPYMNEEGIDDETDFDEQKDSYPRNNPSKPKNRR